MTITWLKAQSRSAFWYFSKLGNHMTCFKYVLNFEIIAESSILLENPISTDFDMYFWYYIKQLENISALHSLHCTCISAYNAVTALALRGSYMHQCISALVYTDFCSALLRTLYPQPAPRPNPKQDVPRSKPKSSADPRKGSPTDRILGLPKTSAHTSARGGSPTDHILKLPSRKTGNSPSYPPPRVVPGTYELEVQTTVGQEPSGTPPMCTSLLKNTLHLETLHWLLVKVTVLQVLNLRHQGDEAGLIGRRTKIDTWRTMTPNIGK